MSIPNGTYFREHGTGPFSLDQTAPTQERGILPRFFKQPRKNKDGTWREVEMVELLVAGDMKAATVKKVTDSIRDRFADAYARYKRNDEIAIDGTPIETWAAVAGHPALVQMLKLHHVYTVEALAEVPDNLVQQLGMGGHRIRDAARLYVENKAGSDSAERLVQENADLKAQLERMQGQIDAILSERSRKAGEVLDAEDGDGGSAGARPDWRTIKTWPDRANYVLNATGIRPKNMAEAESLMAEYEEKSAA